MKLAFIIILLGCSSSLFGESFKRVTELTFQIRVKSSADGASSSSGTAFVVNKAGLLLTNYHVVSPLFKDGKRKKGTSLYITVAGNEFEAKLVRFDMLEDLALVKIPHKFKSQVSVRAKPLEIGEQVYALGYHSKKFLSINQGLFNDYLKGTANEVMSISCSLNPGMSGGPLVDASLNVVGVNVMKSNKESDGYAINAKRLTRFLSREEETGEQLVKNLASQTQSTYQRILALLLEKQEFRTLNNWSLVDFTRVTDCGEFSEEHDMDLDLDDENENKIRTKYFVCRLDFLKVPLSALGTEVNFAYAIANFRGSKNTKSPAYYRYIREKFQFQSLERLRSESDYSCKKSTVRNQHGVTFRTSICAFRHLIVPKFIENEDFFQFEIKAVSLTKGLDDVYTFMRFSGTRDVAKKLVRQVVDGITKHEEVARAAK